MVMGELKMCTMPMIKKALRMRCRCRGGNRILRRGYLIPQSKVRRPLSTLYASDVLPRCIVPITSKPHIGSSSTMILRPVLQLVSLALAAITTQAHRVEIDPGQRQCYFETLQPQDKVCRSAPTWEDVGWCM